jgi:hypothetical protein
MATLVSWCVLDHVIARFIGRVMVSRISSFRVCSKCQLVCNTFYVRKCRENFLRHIIQIPGLIKYGILDKMVIANEV